MSQVNFKDRGVGHSASDHEMIHTYPERKRYRYSGHARAELGMDYYAQEILESVAKQQVTIVQAETGTGKTLRICQMLAQEYPDSKIVMTQTRRPAVWMNGSRIAMEMGCQPGDKVGWLLRGEEPVVSPDTQIRLVIDQSLFNKIKEDGKLPDGFLIIDEAHERSIQIDLLLALIKQYLPSSPYTKVVITSATIDTQKFKNYFKAEAPIVALNPRNYPVEVIPHQLTFAEHHTQGAIWAAKEVFRQFCEGTLTVPPTVLETAKGVW